MNYLFFDIECSNCFDGVGKICEFGYCLVDSKFEIIEKENIFINPQASFHLNRHHSKDNFSLSKPKDFYRECPNFETYYKKIKQILNKKNQMVFAYASSNDLSFLLSTLRRYHLPNIGFDCYDAQKIAAKYLKSKYPGLEKTHDILCPDETEIIAHEASNDAYMTMKVVQEILRREKTTLTKYIQDIPGLMDNSLVEMEKYIEKETILKYKKLLFIADKTKLLDKKIKKKRYFIGYDIKKDPQLHIKVLAKLKEKGYYLVNNLSYTDRVLYINETVKKYYKSLFKWPKRKYKFTQINKLLK